MATQLAFYFDGSSCIGCKACHIACQEKNHLSPAILWRKVFNYGGGDWLRDANHPGRFLPSNVFSYHISISCNHCQNPKCMEVCPTAAISKREDGIVLVNADRCIGCRYCTWACPYGAPQFNEEKGVITKCNFCYDLIDKGENPACVDACVMRCLDFGELEELKAKYGNLDAIAPLPPGDITNPALVITPHKHAKLVGDTSGHILNLPEELE